jgi:hypothetical protein
MDKALVLLEQTKRLKYNILWKPQLFSLALAANINLPLQYTLRVHELQLDSRTVRCILPFLDGPVFDEYVERIGPTGVRQAEETLTEEERKLLMCMLLERSAKTLENFCAAYLTCWEEKVDLEEFPFYLYEIGMCRMLRLYSFKTNAKILYYKYLYANEYVMLKPLSPLLNHSHQYGFDEENYIPVTGQMPRKIVLPPPPPHLSGGDNESLLENSLFYYKLLATSLSANTGRWVECWAYALSALDHYSGQTLVYHHLLCLVALAAGMNSLSSTVCLKALEEARARDSNLEHSWQRLLTFQQLCIQWGFFKLENEAYELCLQLVGFKTVYYFRLIHAHLKSLMLQIEDILLFSVTRRQYHSQCSSEREFCNKPLLLEHSFATMDKLIKEMEPLVERLHVMGEKEFYLGVIHYYRTFKLPSEVDNIDMIHRHIGNKYINIATTLLKKQDERFLHSQIIQLCASFPANIIQMVQDKFTKHTLNRWSVEGAEAAVRAVVFYACSGIIHGYLGTLDVERVLKMYKLATHNFGYRTELLTALVQCQNEDDHLHVLHQANDDYPDVNRVFGYEARESIMARIWFRREKDFLQTKATIQVEQYHSDPFASVAKGARKEADSVSDVLPCKRLPSALSEMSTLATSAIKPRSFLSQHLASCSSHATTRTRSRKQSPVAAKRTKMSPSSKKYIDQFGVIEPTPQLLSLDFLQMDSLGEDVYALGAYLIDQMVAEESEHSTITIDA